MRILIHAANLQKGGALQVATSLLEEFAKYPEHEFYLLAAPPLVEAFPLPGARKNITLTRVDLSPTRGLLAWRRFLGAAREVERSWSPDVAFTIFGPGLWRPRVPHLMGFANGLYLFSDSRFIREDWPVGKAPRMRYAIRRRVLLQRVRREADKWWVETETAQRALAHETGIPIEKIAVIPNALGPAFLPALQQSLPEWHPPRQERPFRVLVMGAAYPNKNLSLIAEMLPHLQHVEVEFRFTLPLEDFTMVFGGGRNDSRIKNLGLLAPLEAPKAYASVDAVMLPSKLETFSAVLLEAAAMQKPLLAPDLPFAREICGDSAAYFNPWSAGSAAEALQDLITNEALRAQLVAAGNSRIKAAPTPAFRVERILDLLQTLADGRRSS